MILINLEIDENGCLKQFVSNGHAGLAIKGKDIACAAATVLLRTTARLLYQEESIIMEGGSLKRGSMECKIQSIAPEKKIWLRGITDLLHQGLVDIEKEYPKNLKVIVSNRLS